jgi:TRAP-type C4-dicarboxylate transport system permease small subunit
VSALRIIAIVLIIAGIAGLAYGTFTYTKATHQTKIGPFDFSVKEKKTVHVPLWAGVASLAAGVLLLVVPGRRIRAA